MRPRSEARREPASGEETGVLRLEDASRGPRGWDLACLRTTQRLDDRAAVDTLPEPMSEEELAPFVWLRRLHAGAWWSVHAAREPADRPAAVQRLTAAVEEVGAALG